MNNIRRAITALALAATLLTISAASAFASHVHVRVIGDGRCVILAEQGGERWVELPDAVFERNPNVDDTFAYPAGRRHPIHVLVHIAEAGGAELYVLGSAAAAANCDVYVNG